MTAPLFPYCGNRRERFCDRSADAIRGSVERAVRARIRRKMFDAGVQRMSRSGSVYTGPSSASGFESPRVPAALPSQSQSSFTKGYGTCVPLFRDRALRGADAERPGLRSTETPPGVLMAPASLSEQPTR